MRRLLPWFILFFPALELWVLIQVGKEIGALATIALLFLSVILGFALLRFRGARIAGGIRTELAAGRIPSTQILDTFCLMAAGWLLLFPGFVSDAMALLLLIPFVRTALFSLIAGKLQSGGFAARTMHYASSSEASGGVHWTCSTYGDTGAQTPSGRGNSLVIDCEARPTDASPGTSGNMADEVAQHPETSGQLDGAATVIDVTGTPSPGPAAPSMKSTTASSAASPDRHASPADADGNSAP